MVLTQILIECLPEYSYDGDGLFSFTTHVREILFPICNFYLKTFSETEIFKIKNSCEMGTFNIFIFKIYIQIVK